MNARSEWFKLKSQSESFRSISTSSFFFIHKQLCLYTNILIRKVMFTFFNISDIATDPPFWKACYRFLTDYYGMLLHLGNIRRKPRVTRHNHPCSGPINSNRAMWRIMIIIFLSTTARQLLALCVSLLVHFTPLAIGRICLSCTYVSLQ